MTECDTSQLTGALQRRSAECYGIYQADIILPAGPGKVSENKRCLSLVLVLCRCITDHCKHSSLSNSHFLAHSSAGQKSRYSAGWALCSGSVLKLKPRRVLNRRPDERRIHFLAHSGKIWFLVVVRLRFQFSFLLVSKKECSSRQPLACGPSIFQSQRQRTCLTSHP